MALKAWIMLAGLSVLWGGSFFFNAILLREVSPFGVVFGRVGIGFLILYAILRLRGFPLSLRRNWRAFLVMGTLNNFVPFNLIVFGQTFVDSSFASIFNATTPLFAVVLAAAAVPEENVTTNKLAGVGLGVIGVAVLLGVGSGRPFDHDTLIGGALVMSAALSYAVAGLFGRRFGSIPPPVTACGMLLASSILCLPPALYYDGARLAALSIGGIGAFLGIGILCTAVAYVLYFRILQLAGAINLLLVTLLIPVSASVLGVLVLGDTITIAKVAGMAVIGLGLLTVDGRIFAFLSHRPRHDRRLMKQLDD